MSKLISEIEFTNECHFPKQIGRALCFDDNIISAHISVLEMIIENYQKEENNA